MSMRLLLTGVPLTVATVSLAGAAAAGADGLFVLGGVAGRQGQHGGGARKREGETDRIHGGASLERQERDWNMNPAAFRFADRGQA
jgi:hypothetical protein